MKILIEWTKKQISLNKWYEQKHWSHRKKSADEWHKFFGVLILMNKKHIPKDVKGYKMSLVYNSNIDPTNTIAMLKLFEDALQKMNIIKGDDKRYCKGFSVTPDTTMAHREYKLELEFI